jgi:hypothetical protein
MEDLPMPDIAVLREAALMEMPFGKYAKRPLMRLPVSYLEWFARKGFPKNKLGMQMQTIYEIKLNGLEEILHQLIKK